MNADLLTQSYRDYCETLLAIRRSGEWKEHATTFDDYAKLRWSLSKTRAKLLCDFAKLIGLCRKEGLPLPDTPENVKPLLSLAQKHWLDVWRLVLDCTGASMNGGPKIINAASVQAVMDRFGIVAHKKLPEHVLKGQRVRRAAKTMAEIGDGEALVGQVGKRGLGKYWDDGVRVVIEADQARMDGNSEDL